MTSLDHIFDEVLTSYQRDPLWARELEGPTVEIRNSFFDDGDLWQSADALKAWVLGFLTGQRSLSSRDEMFLVVVLRRYDDLIGATR